jgi:hypothetical protein
VLFQIETDGNVNRFPYANISAQSMFEDDEKEILFTMGAVFRIQSIKYEAEKSIWHVHLKLTDEEDADLRTLGEYMKEDIVHSSLPMASLAKLMVRMGIFDKAEWNYLKEN